MALKTRAREVEEDEVEEVETDETDIDPAGDEEVGDEDEEQEERPKAKSSKVEKVKPKTKRVVEEDEDEEEEERPSAKKKSKASTEDEEEEEAPRKKASGKKVVKMKKQTEKTKKKIVHRWARHGWKIPYDKDSMVGKVFLKAQEGAKLITLKRMVNELRETKKGGSWVISDLRKGSFNGATWTWNEKNGFVKITNLKMAA